VLPGEPQSGEFFDGLGVLGPAGWYAPGKRVAAAEPVDPLGELLHHLLGSPVVEVAPAPPPRRLAREELALGGWGFVEAVVDDGEGVDGLLGQPVQVTAEGGDLFGLLDRRPSASCSG
jgi:hypothetical protein